MHNSQEFVYSFYCCSRQEEGREAVDADESAGYLTVDEDRGRRLFYYFVESERDPSSDPVVLWLNGGPGKVY